jgi:ribosomal protein S13
MKRLHLLRYYVVQNISLYKCFSLSFGIGITRAKKIGSVLGLHPFFNNKNIFKPRKYRYYQFLLESISKGILRVYKIDSELKREYAANIKATKDIRCFRGFRFVLGLPTRGQRSHTNASSIKGLAASFKGFNIEYSDNRGRKK